MILPTNKALDSYPMSTPILFSTSSVELKVLSRRGRRNVMSQNPILRLGEALPPERWPY